jgi:hypothetical protein
LGSRLRRETLDPDPPAIALADPQSGPHTPTTC